MSIIKDMCPDVKAGWEYMTLKLVEQHKKPVVYVLPLDRGEPLKKAVEDALECHNYLNNNMTSLKQYGKRMVHVTVTPTLGLLTSDCIFNVVDDTFNPKECFSYIPGLPTDAMPDILGHGDQMKLTAFLITKYEEVISPFSPEITSASRLFKLSSHLMNMMEESDYLEWKDKIVFTVLYDGSIRLQFIK